MPGRRRHSAWQSRGASQDRFEKPQRCLIIVSTEIVTQFAGLDDLEISVERAVLPRRQFSQRAELVKGDDFGDLSVPASGVARRHESTLLSQSEDLRAVIKSLSGSGDLTKLTGR